MTGIPGVTPKWAEGLEHRERRFIEQYLVDLNATAAMKRLGTADGGEPYSKTYTAAEAGARMKARPHVAKAIELALNESSVSKMWVIDRIARVARSDLSEIVSIVDGRLQVKDSAEVDPEQLSNITEISETLSEFGRTITVKVHDCKPALFKLAKLFRMEVEKVELAGQDGGPIVVASPRSDIMARYDAIAKRLNESEKPADGA